MDIRQLVGHDPVSLVGARRPGAAPAPPSRFGLRDARAADGAALLALTRAAFAEYAAPMHTVWDAYCRRIAAKLGGAGAAAEHIVAEQGGAIVGSVLLEAAGAPAPAAELQAPRADCPEISLLAVLPTARGQGIGAALLEECVRRARESGAAAVSLHTTELMGVARRMYERRGFVRDPAYDFRPAPHVAVAAYRLRLA